MANGFAHRTLTGWISEFVTRPLPGKWPQIPLDDATLADLAAHFDLCRDSGYNEVVIWGFFVDREWPLDIVSCVDDDRRARIARTIGAAHARGLKIHTGLGIYSWGFDEIIRAHPHLSRGNPRVMCPAVADSRVWMEKIVDFVVGEFPFDGLNMQSADLGRCRCDDCWDIADLEYHARLNAQVADYIHARWPGKLLIVDNWGCPVGGEAQLPSLAALSTRVGYIIDPDNSAARQGGREFRRRAIEALQCPFGTLAGKSVWPPQRWPASKWFLPTTLVNVDYVRELYEDGGRAVEQFVTNLANPSGEVSLRFMGALISEVTAQPQKLLADAVERTYRTRDASTRDGLADLFARAEQAYFSHSGRDLGPQIGLMYLDGGLMPKQDPSPETYLLDMPAADLSAYAAAICGVAKDFEKLRAGIGDAAKADLTARCFESVLADAQRIGSR